MLRSNAAARLNARNPLTAASIAVETLELGYGEEITENRRSLSPKLTAQLLRHAKTQI